MKNYTISSTGIDSYLYDVRRSARKSLGIDEGDRAMYPLTYYINTGRASTGFLHKLFAVSPTRIARVLTGTGSDAEIMERVKRTIRFVGE